MFKKYFLLALRGISRNRSYSFINILGFALGLYVCIIISLYVLDDLTFDHQFEEPENIYRIVSNDNSKDWISAVTVGPLYGFLEENVPEVVAATRIGRYGVRLLRNDIEQPDSMAIFRRALLTDSDYFRVFRPEIISGEKENPLSDPNAVYLTEATAEAIYGDEDPVVGWGCKFVYVGADGEGIGTGASNTSKIVEACRTVGIPARIANDYVLNGYNDWFLPSKDELHLMYTNFLQAGNGWYGMADKYYWSSTEHSDVSAWGEGFDNGSQNEYGKNITLFVRVIRDF